MKNTELFEILEDIDGELIESARRTPGRSHQWKKWAGAIAACLCIALLCGVFAAINRPGNTVDTDPDSSVSADMPGTPDSEKPDLPKLTVEFKSNGMGFEGYMYYSPDEIENGNPWNSDTVIDTLPVYKNLSYDPLGVGIPTGLSQEKMLENLNTVLEFFGIKDTAQITYDNGDGEEITQIIATSDFCKITSYAHGEIAITFTPSLKLPDTLNMTFHSTSDEEAAATLEYLCNKYSMILGFKESEYIIDAGDYNIYGERTRDYEAYDASGDEISDIINYNLYSARFSCDDDGKLWIIRLATDSDIYEEIGNYPIITQEEARELLLSGNYATSVPWEMPGEEYIVKVELIYRTSRLEQIAMPYYRFYVDVTDCEGFGTNNDADLRTYGAYYVPAISGEYIENMPTYDGRFN